MNTESSNQEELTADLLSYAENKYNQKFETVEFIEGKKLGDGSITHTLVLKSLENEKMIFNVKKYIGNETDYMDNFIEEIIANKLTEEFDEIIGKMPGELEFKVYLFPDKKISNVVYSEIEDKSIYEIINQYGAQKITTLLSVNGDNNYIKSNINKKEEVLKMVDNFRKR